MRRPLARATSSRRASRTCDLVDRGESIVRICWWRDWRLLSIFGMDSVFRSLSRATPTSIYLKSTIRKHQRRNRNRRSRAQPSNPSAPAQSKLERCPGMACVVLESTSWIRSPRFGWSFVVTIRDWAMTENGTGRRGAGTRSCRAGGSRRAAHICVRAPSIARVSLHTFLPKPNQIQPNLSRWRTPRKGSWRCC